MTSRKFTGCASSIKGSRTPRTQATRQSSRGRWQGDLLTKILLTTLLTTSASCAAGRGLFSRDETPKPEPVIPVWNGKIYAGDPENAGVKRAQSNEAFKCSEPKFDKFVCLSQEDLKALFHRYSLGCKEWRNPSQTKPVSEAIPSEVR